MSDAPVGRSLTDEEIAGGPIRDVLAELADALRWPAWFDTDQGEHYAEQVRTRLLKELAV